MMCISRRIENTVENRKCFIDQHFVVEPIYKINVQFLKLIARISEFNYPLNCRFHDTHEKIDTHEY